MVKAWKLDENKDLPPSSPRQKTPNEPVDVKSLEKLGIYHQKIDLASPLVHTNYKEDPALVAYRTENEYSQSDILTVSREGLKNYDETLKSFFKEHFHPDDESRYILEGSGYFDVRNDRDEWIRLRVQKGDLITIPAGMYHRFALDEEQNYLKSVRMFVSDAIWTPHEDHFSRQEYLKKYSIPLCV